MENNTINDEKYFNWISGIIDSCTDTFHFEALDNLIEFHNKILLLYIIFFDLLNIIQ
jgi:hypothetical protein